MTKANITIEIIDNEHIPIGLRNYIEYKKKNHNFKNTKFSFHEDGIEIFPDNENVMFFYIYFIKSIKLDNINKI